MWHRTLVLLPLVVTLVLGETLHIEHPADTSQQDTSLDHPAASSKGNRESKLLPLVKIVSFKNTECQSSYGHIGTCYSASECTAAGGVAAGSCAKSYGVCCVVKKSCGEVISVNNTYFINPGHPTGYTTPGMCMVEIKPPVGTCQILFTFKEFDILGPVAGDCNNDTYTFIGGNPGTNVPVLCGYNSGQHYYVDIDQTHGPFKIVTTTSVLSYSRKWKVQVTFISNTSPYKAPPHCLQYHRGVTGMVASFNSGGIAPQVINNLKYAVCFACLPGYCNVGLNFNLFDYGVAAPVCADDYVATGPVPYCGQYSSLAVSLNTTCGPLTLYVASDYTNDLQEPGFVGSYMRLHC